MSFLKELKSLLGRDAIADAQSRKSTPAQPLFVYVRMPGDMDPFERSERFADPLQEALEAARLGTVTGGGSMFSPPDDEGDRDVEYCGVDVDLYQLEEGLALLRRELIRLEAPPGTALLYELDGHEYEEPIYRLEI